MVVREVHVDSYSRIIDYFNNFEISEFHFNLILCCVRNTSLNLISKSLSIFRDIFNASNLAKNIQVDILFSFLFTNDKTL